MQNQQWNNVQGNSPQQSVAVPSAYMNQPRVPVQQSPLIEAPPYQEENWLEESSSPKKGHPILKAFGLMVLLIGLFCLSTLAGMLSDGKRPIMSLFKNSSSAQPEVKGVTTTVPSSSTESVGLAVTNAGEVGQAAGTNDNNATLSPNSAFYQYVDTLKSDQITVARQPLPDDFKGNPAALSGLAARIGANQSFSTNAWGTAYMMATSDVQVVVIADQKHMIFLRSTQPHTQQEWAQYIESFTPR